jgi:hypothetical protein
MNKDNQLEQQLDRLGERIASQPSILDAVMQRVETMEAPARPGRRLGRTIMKSGIGLAASFAAVVLAVLLFNKSVPLSLADVQQAVALQTWVHIKFDSGREEWFDLANERYFLKEQGFITNHRMLYRDRAAGVLLEHWPWHGRHITRHMTGPWPGPRSPWECLVGMLGERIDTETKRQYETVDGRHLVRFDDCFDDAYGKPVLRLQVWADPQTRLPVRVRRLLDPNDRRELKREYTVGECDFPASGPTRLEDIGVPEGLPIVDADRPTPQDAQQIVEAGRAARARFPRNYRVIRYGENESGNIHIYWRCGDRFRLDNYSNIQPYVRDFEALGYDKYHIELPATAEQLLAWARNQEDVHETYVVAEGRSYRRNDPHPAISNAPTEPEARVQKFSGPPDMRLVNSPHWPHNQPWPYANTRGPWQVLQLSEDLQPGCMGLRYEGGDIRRDCIIDPARDYICVNYIWWKQVDGQWQKDRQTEARELRQLPTGQWYPMQWKGVSWMPGRAEPHETIYQDDVELINEADLPPDLFDGEKLLEGAKVETY